MRVLTLGRNYELVKNVTKKNTHPPWEEDWCFRKNTLVNPPIPQPLPFTKEALQIGYAVKAHCFQGCLVKYP